MTGCRIGKITMKDGSGTIHRFPDKNMSVFQAGCTFDHLKEVNELVRHGRARMVATAIIRDDNYILTDFSKRECVNGVEVIGAVEILRRTVMDWMNS